MTTVLTTLNSATGMLGLLPAIAPNPIDEGTLRPGLDPSQVTPGLIGFLMTLFLAVVVILLFLDFNRRNRRLRYRAEYAERRAAEERTAGGTVPDRRTGPQDASDSARAATAGRAEDGAAPSSGTDERSGPR
ncbi:hypothetical protein [Kocuria dechangensis]|uniref:hypothetical protein n=1 Tax=Kocuria dechangensis TaxID=1176249 RepID=UPI001E44E23C|nr:hypothetical protein [Kocuria dechangensis]